MIRKVIKGKEEKEKEGEEIRKKRVFLKFRQRRRTLNR